MLVFSTCNGACRSTPLAYASCSKSDTCSGVGSGYRIDWEIRGRDGQWSGSCDCGSSIAGMCPIPGPGSGFNGGAGLYMISAKLVDTQSNSVVDEGSVVAIYDPSSVSVDIDGDGYLHVIDHGSGLGITKYVEGSVSIPRYAVAFVEQHSGGKVRLVTASGATPYSDAAKIAISMSFSSSNDVARWLMRFAGDKYLKRFSFIDADCNSILSDDVHRRILVMYALDKLMHSGLGVAGLSVDWENNRIYLSIAVRPGGIFGFDIGSVARWLSGGCALGVLLSVGGALVTGGLAAGLVPLSIAGCISGGLLGLAADVVGAAIVEPIASGIMDVIGIVTGRSSMPKIISDDVAKIDATISDVEKVINDACSSGRLDEATCSKLKADLESVKTTVAEHKKHLADMLKDVRTVAVASIVVGFGGGLIVAKLLGK